MKKVVIFVALATMIFAMSSAYALWSDNVSVSVSAESAVILVQYVDRDNPSNVTYIRQNGSDVSLTNPYSSITEDIEDWYPNIYGNKRTYNRMFRVIYTIQNNGTVPVKIDGINVSGFTVNAYSYYASELTWQQVMDTAYIQYKLKGSGFNQTVTVNDIESSAMVDFTSGSDIVLDPGEDCTLTVKYIRDLTGDDRLDYYTWIELLDKTDKIKFSVY